MDAKNRKIPPKQRSEKVIRERARRETAAANVAEMNRHVQCYMNNDAKIDLEEAAVMDMAKQVMVEMTKLDAALREAENRRNSIDLYAENALSFFHSEPSCDAAVIESVIEKLDEQARFVDGEIASLKTKIEYWKCSSRKEYKMNIRNLRQQWYRPWEWSSSIKCPPPELSRKNRMWSNALNLKSQF